MESLASGCTLFLDRSQPKRFCRLDRLSALTLTLALAACSSDAPAPATSSRVVAVQAQQGDGPTFKSWCDVAFEEGNAPTLELPAVEVARGSVAPTAPADRWVWVNLWATWCGPCKQEMPTLVTWRDHLNREGVPFDLWFVSVDEDKGELASFLQANPSTAPEPSLRMTALSDLEPFLKKLTMDSSSIPIQVIAGPGGKVRCVRGGSLREDDYGIVKQLLSSKK